MITFELVSMTGYRVRFISQDIDGNPEDYHYLINAYLPGVNLSPETQIKPNVTIVFHESENKSLNTTADIIAINDLWDGKISLDLWHLMYSLVRQNLLSHNLFSVHAACAGKNKMVLLVGHSGMGKTTLMLRLVSDYDWSIFSGNKTVIDFSKGICAVAGTKTISIKESDIVKYPNLKQTSVIYSNRTALQLDNEYFDNRLEVPISAICIVKVDDGHNESIELSYPSNMHSLYPFFMDTVYADTIMCDGEEVYSGDPPPETRNLLSRKLKNSLPSIKVFNMLGSVKYLANQIKTLI